MGHSIIHNRIRHFRYSRLTFGAIFGVFSSPIIVAYQRALRSTSFTSHSYLTFVNVAQPKRTAEHERMKLPLQFMKAYILVNF